MTNTVSLIEKFQTALNDARIGLEHSEGNEKMAAICDTWEEAIHLIRQHQVEQLTKTPEDVTKETVSNVSDTLIREAFEKWLGCTSSYTGLQWKVWQAAWEASQAQRGEISLIRDVPILLRLSTILSKDNTGAEKLDEIMDLFSPYLKREISEDRPFKAEYEDEAKGERSYPKLLSEDEKQSLLQKAEALWNALEENNLGGFSGINRPFLILHEFKEVIEKYGNRDVGLTWSSNDLRKAKSQIEDGAGK